MMLFGHGMGVVHVTLHMALHDVFEHLNRLRDRGHEVHLFAASGSRVSGVHVIDVGVQITPYTFGCPAFHDGGVTDASNC